MTSSSWNPNPNYLPAGPARAPLPPTAEEATLTGDVDVNVGLIDEEGQRADEQRRPDPTPQYRGQRRPAGPMEHGPAAGVPAGPVHRGVLAEPRVHRDAHVYRDAPADRPVYGDAPAEPAVHRDVPAAFARTPERHPRSGRSADVQRPAKSGWRKAARACTFGTWDPGWSQWELEEEQLVRRLRIAVPGDGENVVFMMLKGGVGKTVGSLGASETLSSRAGRVLAIDANTSWGTFPYRIGQPNRKDVLDLLDDPRLFERDPESGIPIPQPTTNQSDFAQYTGKGATTLDRTGLELLSGPREVGCDDQLTPEGYRAMMKVAARHYPVRVTDCGTNVKEPLTQAALDLADLVVIVTTLDGDGIEGARLALQFLTNFPTDRRGQSKIELSRRPYVDLARRAIVVVNEYAAPGKSGDMSPEEAVRYFTDRLASVPGSQAAADRVIRLPHDPHLREGGAIRDDLLRRATKRAFLRIAAGIADDFDRPRTRRESR